jgi:hypothetical protein
MNMNGYKLKPDAEQTEYQKRLDAIDNVILCMAEAEKMISEIGRHLVVDLDIDEKRLKCTNGKSVFSWSGRKVSPR